MSDRITSNVNVWNFAECRAQEIFNCMQDVARKEPKLASQNLPFNMRRRAASLNPKRLPKNKRVKSALKQENSKHKKQKHCHKDRLTKFLNRQLKATWLPTHIWFAKRFHMKKIYGYKLPLHSTGKTFRVAFKAATRKTLLQDLSYYCCIELKGPERKLLCQLSTLTHDSLGIDFSSQLCIDGSKEGQCVLYHPYSYPFRAIGPVSFLWKPYSDNDCRNMSGSCDASPKKAIRQLWIWCHPSIYSELLQVLAAIFKLKENCAKVEDSPIEEESEIQLEDKKPEHNFASKINYKKTKLYFKKERVFTGKKVTMTSLKDTLVRLRLTGPLSLSTISKVLRFTDVSTSIPIPSDEAPRSTPSWNHSSVNGVDHSPVDAKLWWQKYYECEEKREVHAMKMKLLENLRNVNFSYMLPSSSVIGLTVKDPRLDWSSKKIENEDCFQGNNKDLAILSDFQTNCASSALWDKEIRDEVTETQMPESEINKEKSKFISTKDGIDLGLYENRVPIIIVHQLGFDGVGSGWDLIAPLGWGMAFWIPLYYSGTHPAGIRDIHNVNLESGVPNFPNSYPDTAAGKLHQQEDQEENTKKFLRYPPNRRPNFETFGTVSPFNMPWVTLLDNWENELENQHSEWARKICSSSDVSSEKDGNNIFVLRSKKMLKELKTLNNNISKAIHTLGEQRTVISLHGLINSLNSFASLCVSCVSEVGHMKRAVVLVKIKSLCKGTPKKFSAIYLPNESDWKLLKENPKLLNPMEPNHLEPRNKRPRLSKKEKKEKLKNMLSSWKTPPENLFSSSERKVIGFVSEGGFSSLRGFGCGIGHCAFTGLLTLLEHCITFRVIPVLLFREQNSFQYRPAHIEVIDLL